MPVVFSETPQTSPNFDPRYSTDESYLKRLGDELLSSGQPEVRTRFACYQVPGTDERSNLGRSVELREFKSTFDNTEEDMLREYGSYEETSRFFIVMDRKKAQVAGTLRVLENGPNGLKSLNDIAQEPLNITKDDFRRAHNVDDLDSVWDAGTLGVLREYRRVSQHKVSSMLFRAVQVSALHEGIDHYVSIVDKRVYDTIKMLGMSHVPIADSKPFPYLGSKVSIAIYGYVPEMIPRGKENFKDMVRYSPLKALLLARSMARLTLGTELDKTFMFEH